MRLYPALPSPLWDLRVCRSGRNIGFTTWCSAMALWDPTKTGTGLLFRGRSPVRDDKIVARQFSAGWAPARGKSHRDGRTGRKNDFFAKPSWLADYCAKKADITLPKSFAVRAPDDYFPSARMEARNWVSCSLSPASCWRASLVVILPERSASDSFMTVFMNSGE